MDPGGFQVGAILVSRYQIERVLGQGGMGIVVKAMHLQLQQPVAMKFLLPEVLGNQQIVQRFLREAQAAVRLRSEHVARVIDVGSLETGAPYMVLEYLDGADLSSFPRTHLTIGGIVDLVLQACEALAEAHSLGIVHRDIKPANFFITRGADGAPLLKVLDFGISKAPMQNSQLTATQTVMGTPAYMSPEQMRSSRDVDHRSDIWSLGIVLYELLQGTPPFAADTFSSMVIKVVTDPLPRLNVHLPGELDAIVYRCLEKDPARRFQNVAELAQAIAPYAQSPTQAAISVQRTRSIIGVALPPSAFERDSARHALPSTLEGSAGARTMPPGTGRRRWPLIAGLGVLVGVIVGVIVISSTSGSGSGGGGGDTEEQAPSARPEASPRAAADPGSAAARPPAPPPVATAPLDAAPAPPSAPEPPTPAATAGSATTAAASTATSSPSSTEKKPKKTPKASGSASKPPASTDDDVLGSRH
jgi:serine/threonine protein kinase